MSTTTLFFCRFFFLSFFSLFFFFEKTEKFFEKIKKFVSFRSSQKNDFEEKTKTRDVFWAGSLMSRGGGAETGGLLLSGGPFRSAFEFGCATPNERHPLFLLRVSLLSFLFRFRFEVRSFLSRARVLLFVGLFFFWRILLTKKIRGLKTRSARNDREFNEIQRQMLEFILTQTETSFVCSAPTGSGKTVLMELALLAGLFTTTTSTTTTTTVGVSTTSTTMERRGEGRTKVVYLAPLKALVAEKKNDWERRFGNGTRFNLRFVLLTGDVMTRSSEFWREVDRADVILATPEKMDSLSRRHSSNGFFGFFGSISVVLIDEIHVLGDSSRGATLEAIVSRLKAIGQSLGEETALHRCRYVAVSATAPNMKEVGEWLSGGSNAVTTTWEFGEEYREVRLETVCRDCGYSNNDYLFQNTLNAKLLDVVLDHYERCPSLIFCATPNVALSAAKKLEEDIRHRSNAIRQAFVTDDQAKMKLVQAATRAKNKALKQLLPRGIAFHHGHLEKSDRDLVETLFRERAILALCSTSTLALGVNLPARLVVVCGTKKYKGNGNYTDIDRGTLLQMAGRAGRPGLDQRGVVVVMTDTHSKPLFENLLHNIEPITSKLEERLPETINAEVVSGVIYSIPSCVQWLTNTFMFTRKKCELTSPAPEAEAFRWAKKLAVKTLDELKAANLCEFNEFTDASRANSVSVKEEGRIMSTRYVRFETFKQFQHVLSTSSVDADEATADASTLRKEDRYKDVLATPSVDTGTASSLFQHEGLPASVGKSETEILRSVLSATCKAKEFGEICVRKDEKTKLKELNNNIRVPLFRCDKKGNRITKNTPIKSGWEKLYVLTQHELSEAKEKENNALVPSLKRDVESLRETAPRLLKAAHELYISRKDFSHAVCAYQLMKSIESKKWYDSQLPHCGTKTLKSLPSEVCVSLEINNSGGPANDNLSTPSPLKTPRTKKKIISFPSVNIRVEFVSNKRSSGVPFGGLSKNFIYGNMAEDAESSPRAVRLPKKHPGVLFVGCEHDNRIIFRTKLPAITERVLNSREDCLVLESKCFAHSLPIGYPSVPVKFLARVFFDGLVGRDAFGWAVSNNTLAAIPSTEKFVREKIHIYGTGGRRLQTVTPRVAQTTMLDAKTTETKNDDNYNNNNDHNTTNDDGKMTVTQNRTNVGLAQMRKTKQTTLVPSFPMSGKRKKDENISPRTNNPPTTNIAVKTGATTDAHAIRELWGCNWAGDDDSDDEYPFDDSKEKKKKSLTAAPASCSNDDHNWSEDSWDFAT